MFLPLMTVVGISATEAAQKISQYVMEHATSDALVVGSAKDTNVYYMKSNWPAPGVELGFCMGCFFFSCPCCDGMFC